jgi:excisionase family DNA binding protein
LCPRLLDLPAAAAYLAVSVWTVRDLVHAGELKPVRLPAPGGRELRRILLDVSDLNALIERGKA